MDTTAPVTCTKLNPLDLCVDAETRNYLSINHNIHPQKNKLSKTWLFPAYKLTLWNFKDGHLKDDLQETKQLQVKLYKKRYLILFLFCVCNGLNAFQFVQYSIISNIIECYHDVTPFEVNWTSTVYMVVYGILVFPVSWFLNRYGIRATVLVGSSLNCLSAVTQCLSLNKDGFPIALFSQTVSAIAQVFILPLPTSLAAAWFPAQQAGRATAIGVFSNLFGSAIGFIVPTVVVTNDCTKPELIKFERSSIAYALTAINCANFLFLLIFFQKKPPLPPNETLNLKNEVPFKQSMLVLAKYHSFLLLLLGYGLITGVAMAIGTLLNQILEPMFPNSEGFIGLTAIGAIVSGFISSYIGEHFTDTTRKYKKTTIAYCIGGLLSVAALSAVSYLKILWVQCLAVLATGCFATGYIAVGVDYATEITYPEPEGISASLMNASSMIFSAVLTMIGSYILQASGERDLGFFFFGTLTIATVIFYIMKPELRRTKAQLQTNPDDTKKF